MYQRFGQTSIPIQPLDQRGNIEQISHNNEGSPFQPQVKSPETREPLQEKIPPSEKSTKGEISIGK
jgi:hypothetical protein